MKIQSKVLSAGTERTTDSSVSLSYYACLFSDLKFRVIPVMSVLAQLLIAADSPMHLLLRNFSSVMTTKLLPKSWTRYWRLLEEEKFKVSQKPISSIWRQTSDFALFSHLSIVSSASADMFVPYLGGN